MKNTVACLMVLSLLAFSLPAGAASVFKWTDDDGVVHFSDQPVAGDAESVDLRIGPAPRDAGASSRSEPVREESAADGDDEVARHQAEVREANCRIARDTLEHNRNIHRMYRLDESGERVFLTDEERAELLQRSRDDVAQWCDD